MNRTDKKLLRLVAKKLREHRRAKEWTLEQVAKKVGVEASTLHKYESATISVPWIQYVRWCMALKVNAGELMNDALAAVFRRR